MGQKVGIIQKVIGMLKRDPAKPAPAVKTQARASVKAGSKASKKAVKKTAKVNRR